MGGCYDTTYSSCSQPSWQDNVEFDLGQFFRSQDRTKLVAAYNTFMRSSSMGYIKQLLKNRGVSEAPKEFPDIEYEVKMSIVPIAGKGPEPSITDYLDAFEFPAHKGARFIKDPVNTNAEGNNHFFGSGLDEMLVVIEKAGKTYIKEKSQPIELTTNVPYQHIVIKRTEDRYPATLEEIMRKVSEVAGGGADYHGFLRKEKGDAFILDTSDGRIYSFTVTRAHHGEKVQRQLEIEYAGFVPGFNGYVANSEPQIVAGMVDLAKHVALISDNAVINNGWRMRLKLTDERKYDFISGAKKELSEPAQVLPFLVAQTRALEPAKKKR